jgi:hypothetical protein
MPDDIGKHVIISAKNENLPHSVLVTECHNSVKTAQLYLEKNCPGNGNVGNCLDKNIYISVAIKIIMKN